MINELVQREAPVADASRARPRRRGVLLGLIAGTLGLGCCVYPVVLALLGMSSATAAVDLGNRLYSEWGWAFKGAAVIFAGLALMIQRRRAKRCSVGTRTNMRTQVLLTLVVGVGTFALLYLATKGASALA